MSPGRGMWIVRRQSRDLGGQEVFHFDHHLFMTNNGFNLFVFDLISLLKDASADLGALETWSIRCSYMRSRLLCYSR